MPLQTHIHLSDSLGAGPEFAPTLSWKVNLREEMPMIIMDMRRTLTGVLTRNILRDSLGNELQLLNYHYVVKLSGSDRFTNLALLRALNGKEAYHCDSIHAADASDHSADVRPVVVQVGKTSHPAADDPLLQFILVEIELEDNAL